MNIQGSLEIAFSLTPADYAQRLREFRRLLTSALRGSHLEPNRPYLSLDPSAAREEDVRDLLRREQECCVLLVRRRGIDLIDPRRGCSA